jgi:hypothetical protein
MKNTQVFTDLPVFPVSALLDSAMENRITDLPVISLILILVTRLSSPSGPMARWK